ncbi:hypothetical protein [Pantoea phage Nafs113]|nr:hypothetical protein [Pantoea phage Nafs113]
MGFFAKGFFWTLGKLAAFAFTHFVVFILALIILGFMAFRGRRKK